MKRWYVVQVYTGFEDIVKLDIEKRIQENNVQDFFGEILIPKGQVTSLFMPEEDREKKEKIFPGYLLIQMEMSGDTYRMIISVPRVSRFLGGERPVPLSNKEVERIFAQISGELPVSEEKLPFSEGTEIHIANGPFAGFVGIIDKIDEEKEKLTIMVSIFGRLTPVEIGFDQIKR